MLAACGSTGVQKTGTAPGGTYSAGRVRLSAERATVPATPAEPVPEGVPLPPGTQARGKQGLQGR
nr:hypothetical protein GCM10020093_033690 [Planobispora longispora]